MDRCAMLSNTQEYKGADAVQRSMERKPAAWISRRSPHGEGVMAHGHTFYPDIKEG